MASSKTTSSTRGMITGSSTRQSTAMSRVIPREILQSQFSAVSKGASTALNVDRREIERDLKYLSTHQNILISHANKDLRAAFNRVVSRAHTLYGTQSYADFYETIKNVFCEEHFSVLRIGSIGAYFRGYEAYKGDEKLRYIAPTVLGAILPPNVPRPIQPSETSVTIQRRSHGPSQLHINNKGNHRAYLFIVGRDIPPSTNDCDEDSVCEDHSAHDPITTLLSEEILFLKAEGVTHCKIIDYTHEGEYCLRHQKNFISLSPVDHEYDHSRVSHHQREDYGSAGMVIIAIVLLFVLVAMISIIRSIRR